MIMMRSTRTPMHFIGSADFWCSSALCSCDTPSLVCSTTFRPVRETKRNETNAAREQQGRPTHQNVNF